MTGCRMAADGWGISLEVLKSDQMGSIDFRLSSLGFFWKKAEKLLLRAGCGVDGAILSMLVVCCHTCWCGSGDAG